MKPNWRTTVRCYTYKGNLTHCPICNAELSDKQAHYCQPPVELKELYEADFWGESLEECLENDKKAFVAQVNNETGSGDEGLD